MPERDTKPVESADFALNSKMDAMFPTWIKVGAVAAASALAGGLAAAWFYRKTLNSLRQAESGSGNSDFRIQGRETDDDT